MVLRSTFTHSQFVVTRVAIRGRFRSGDRVEVLWSGQWYKAKVVEAGNNQWRITYEGYSSSWDEIVGADRIRPRGTATASAVGAPNPPYREAVAAPPTVSSHSFPPRPADALAGMDGAFIRVASAYVDGAFTGVHEAWFFTEEGRVRLNPCGGHPPEDLVAAEDASAGDGVYWLEPDALLVHWAGHPAPVKWRWEIRADGMRLLDGLALVPGRRFPRGWQAEAHYVGASATPAAYQSGRNSLRLHADGRFDHGPSHAWSASSTEGGGMYSIDGYTLTLVHSDGQVERRTFVGVDAGEAGDAPELLWCDGLLLRRQPSGI